MAYVYILSEHEEHGAENVEATLDRSLLQWMLERRLEQMVCRPGEKEGFVKSTMSRFQGLSNISDEELVKKMTENGGSGISLSGLWGGPQLHVIKLAE